MIYFEANVTTTVPVSSNMNYGNTNELQPPFNQSLQSSQQQQIPQPAQQSYAKHPDQHYQQQQQQQPEQQQQHQHHQHQPQQAQYNNMSDYAYSGINQPQPGLGDGAGHGAYGHQTGKFNSNDIQLLKQLLVVGEKYKWKQITKEINQRTERRRKEMGNSEGSKKVSPTFVIKQYQNLLGLPSNSLHFGVLGSSLAYVVGNNGWDDVPEHESHFIDDVE